jgi:hypothetical protein
MSARPTLARARAPPSSTSFTHPGLYNVITAKERSNVNITVREKERERKKKKSEEKRKQLRELKKINKK